jgi:hypothetical protein
MANEYKAWYRRNDPQDARKDWSAYNRPFGERYERPKEYGAYRGDAYRHYPERYDITADQEKKRQGSDSQSTQEKSRRQQARSARMGQNAVRGVMQSIVGPTVAAVVGAVVLVSGYQAIEAEKAAELTAAETRVPVVAWKWSEDDEGNKSAAITFTYEDGTVVKQLTATTISVSSELAPTCAQDGFVVYAATVTDGDTVYTDEHRDTLPATGKHEFDDGTVSVDEHGQSTIVFECKHCHKKVTGKASSVENE